MDTFERNLIDAGLDEREAKIYLALLRSKESNVTDLARKTSVNRSMLYEILDNMGKRGLVTYILKDQKRYYKPINPKKILEKLKEKQKVLETIMPKLLALSTQDNTAPIIEILDGKEGIKTILENILESNAEWCAIAPGKSVTVLGSKADSFEKEREAKGIPLRIIFANTSYGHGSANRFKRMKNTKVKMLLESYDMPASTWVFGKIVAFAFWYKEHPFAIRITSKEFADGYYHYFNSVWKALPDFKL